MTVRADNLRDPAREMKFRNYSHERAMTGFSGHCEEARRGSDRERE